MKYFKRELDLLEIKKVIKSTLVQLINKRKNLIATQNSYTYDYTYKYNDKPKKERDV